MAGVYLAVEVNLTGKSIADLNDRCANSGNKHDVINGVINALMGLASGEAGTVKVVVKDAASTINTSGSGSSSNTY